MIGSLRGRLIDKKAPVVMLECAGVGYEVETPMSTFLDLPGVDAELFLYTHLISRDDLTALYGFATFAERQLFRTLLKVSGVGAKMGLAILSAMSSTAFAAAVSREDTAALVRIPGVGKKTAERLIIEMRDKLDASDQSDGASADTVAGIERSVDPTREASDALISLGYKPKEVNSLLAQVDTKGKVSEDIIRDALRQIAGQPGA